MLDSPFGIRHIARIIQAAAIGSAAMFGLPHRHPRPRSPGGLMKRQNPFPPFQQLSGSALSITELPARQESGRGEACSMWSLQAAHAGIGRGE